MQDMINLFVCLAQRLASVQQVNRELDAVLDSFCDGIWITDGACMTVRVNRAVERITGLNPDSLLGKNIYSLVQDGITDSCVAFEVLKKKEPVIAEQSFAGGVKAIVTGYPIFDDEENITGVVMRLREPNELNELKSKLEQARLTTERLNSEINELHTYQLGADHLVANSKVMRDVLDAVHRVARLKSSVLLFGRAGVGKEMVARITHISGGREGSFINANCRAIPPGMLESILFGREQSGVVSQTGLFEMADRGTLFITEVADIPTDLQKKVLAVVQEGQFTRVGGVIPVKVDVRVIAASEKNLKKLVNNGKFLRDLSKELEKTTIAIPPLHKRSDDIPLLLQRYTQLFNEKYSTNKRFSVRAVELLVDYEWPENVRELVNLVERLVVTVENKLILPKHLPSYILKSIGNKGTDSFKPLKEAVAELEFELIKNAVDIYGSTYKAANILGVSQPTVVRKLQKYSKKSLEVSGVSAANGG
ncbi:PAS domain S-box-containing protein [Desulfoscipio geothermicus DSM 3669]|uniref:PAS domain S-box-containing protein n=2 Tax=Desulfoscipio geothermicus TaxID=39060 RepID=A0A1I6CPQ4_9FIRM|nr:PAS domain S-box-containing protein [Desulfoscipio geothermicus DSM 3669]